jgi:hypothetical protein
VFSLSFDKSTSDRPKGLAARPRVADCSAGYWTGLYANRRPAKAVPHLKAALPTDEDDSLRYQLARAYQMTGEKELASTMLREYQQKQETQHQENADLEKEVALTPPR